jgi:hypothetical protein
MWWLHPGSKWPKRNPRIRRKCSCPRRRPRGSLLLEELEGRNLLSGGLSPTLVALAGATPLPIPLPLSLAANPFGGMDIYQNFQGPADANPLVTPLLGNEPNQITNFIGFYGGVRVQGDGIGHQGSEENHSFFWDADLRFMKASTRGWMANSTPRPLSRSDWTSMEVSLTSRTTRISHMISMPATVRRLVRSTAVMVSALGFFGPQSFQTATFRSTQARESPTCTSTTFLNWITIRRKAPGTWPPSGRPGRPAILIPPFPSMLFGIDRLHGGSTSRMRRTASPGYSMRIRRRSPGR